MQSPRKHKLIFLILFVILSVFSCFNNAERDNPLDPRSSKYQNLGGIEGHVYTYYAPFQPLSSAMVTLTPGGQTTFSDGSGGFSFQNVDPGNYAVHVNYPDYASDSTQVQVQSNQIASIQFNLNGLPRLDSLFLITGVEYDYTVNPNEDPTRLIGCTTEVIDSDGPADIASVVVSIPTIGIKDTLGLTQNVGTYYKRIEELDLPISHIDELMGQPFYIEIKDRVGAVCQYGPKYLVRVIEVEPEIISPQEFNVVSSQPVLKWNPSQFSFPISYRIEIYLLIGYQIIIPAIRSYSDISSAISEFQISKPLAAGFYLWTVYAVDQFGNWSRSKPATFEVGE